MNSLIDSHCHIDFPQFDATRASTLEACRLRGMEAIVVPGVSARQWPDMDHALARYADSRRYPRLLPTYGLHPCFMIEHRPEHLGALEQQLDRGAVAVGEIGLDSFYGDQDLDQQLALFTAQIAIAKNHSLPVLIHSRKTQDLILKTIRQQRFECGGIMHAFSGSLQQAQQACELGFKIGFGGAATYARATRLRKIFSSLPSEAIVFETDAPDIPPCFARDQPNSPLNLFRIVQILSELREEGEDELIRSSSQNVVDILNIVV